MTLIMENWQKYVNEVENDWGILYLFENDVVRETSFYERFNSLQESEEDLDIFLKEWEKSVDYAFENLNEQTGAQYKEDPILALSTQAWSLLQKGKDAVKSVFNFVPKAKEYLKTKQQENPKLVKVALVSLTGLVAAAVAIGTMGYIQAGGSPEDIVNLASQGQEILPDAVQNIPDPANLDASAVAELVSGQEDIIDQAAQQLGNVDDKAAQQMTQQIGKTAETIPDDPMSWLDDMFDEIAAEKAGAPAGAEDPWADFNKMMDQMMDQRAGGPDSAHGPSDPGSVPGPEDPFAEFEKMHDDPELKRRMRNAAEAPRAAAPASPQPQGEFDMMSHFQGKSRSEIRDMVQAADSPYADFFDTEKMTLGDWIDQFRGKSRSEIRDFINDLPREEKRTARIVLRNIRKLQQNAGPDPFAEFEKMMDQA